MSSLRSDLQGLERFEAVATQDPDRPCLLFEGTSFSYAQVRHRSRLIAAALLERDLGPGHRVAVLSPNHALGVITTMGVLTAGATWVPLNPRDSAGQTASLLERFCCDALVFHSSLSSVVPELRSRAPSVRAVVCLDSDRAAAEPLLEWIGVPDALDRTFERDPDAIAAIFPTGGTTGDPRGVCFKYRTLSTITEFFVASLLPSDPRPVFLAAGPLTHVSGRACLGVMAAGGTTAILPKFEPTEVLRAVPQHRISFMIVVPTMLTALVADSAAHAFEYSSLQSMYVGATPLPVNLLKRALDVFGPVVFQAYGQTEAPMFIARKRPGDDVVDGKLAGDERLRSCGRATEFSDIQILGPDLRALAAEEVGEIAVRGDFVMDGYHDDPEDTAATSAGDYHRTGDLGFLDADGFLTITGRATEMIISGGFNVFPAEVEAVLAELPEVGESAVVGVSDEQWGETVLAIIEPTRGAVVDPETVLRYARARLGGVKAPKRVLVVDELPRNPNGKVLKRVLIDRVANAD